MMTRMSTGRSVMDIALSVIVEIQSSQGMVKELESKSDYHLQLETGAV